MHQLLHDIAYCIVTAWLFGVLAHFFRQPAILAYLVGGFIIGPNVVGLVKGQEEIQTISELGLIFLLFMIGLEIDLKKIARAGRSITVTGAVQVLGGTVLGVLFFKMIGVPLGGGQWDALYLAVAAALSSTVIIVKILYDKRELDTVTGRVTLGVLVLQDLFAILFLAVQPSLNELKVSVIAMSFGRVIVLVGTAMAVSRYILPVIFRAISRMPELVLVGALAWCFLLGEFGSWLKLSREMGALVAGVSLSTFPYALDVTAKVTSLRDFFVTLFFVGLGMTIPLPNVQIILWAAGFAVFVVFSRWLTTFTPLYAMGQGLRASVLPALNLSQISEFSLVVLQLGVLSNHISAQTKGMASLSFVMLAAISATAMMKSDGLTRRLVPMLKRSGLKDLDQVHAEGAHGGDGHGAGARIVILGFFRTASSLLSDIRRDAPELLKDLAVVDFSPVAREGLQKQGVRVIYGDISQRDTLAHAGISSAQMIVCSVPESLLKGTTNEKLVRQLHELAPDAKILVTAETLDAVPILYAAGADYVSVGRLFESGDLLSAMQAVDSNKLPEKRAELEQRMAARDEILP
jgi:Kef-type K+ transport system membrane component KefB